MQFKISGKMPECMAKDELRSLLHATSCLLEFHNMFTEHTLIKVIFIDDYKTLGKNEITGGDCWGRASPHDGWIKLYRNIRNDQLVTLVIHEMLHIYSKGEWTGSREHITDMLTARFKPDIIGLQAELIANSVPRRAYKAHALISYKLPLGEDDRYNDESWEDKLETDKYETDEQRRQRHKRLIQKAEKIKEEQRKQMLSERAKKAWATRRKNEKKQKEKTAQEMWDELPDGEKASIQTLAIMKGMNVEE